MNKPKRCAVQADHPGSERKNAMNVVRRYSLIHGRISSVVNPVFFSPLLAIILNPAIMPSPKRRQSFLTFNPAAGANQLHSGLRFRK